MKRKELKNIILVSLEECGIVLMEGEEEEELEMDSMQYVSLIVQLEDALDIMIDDEYLIMQKLNVNLLIKMISKYIKIED